MTASTKRSCSSGARRSRCGPRQTVSRYARGSSGLDGPGLQPAAHRLKSRSAKALLGELRRGEVPRHRPVREASGQARVGRGPQRGLVHRGHVALAPALRADPPAGCQRGGERGEQRVVVGHPVKRRVGEHRVDVLAVAQAQRREIGLADVDRRILKLGARAGDHVGVGVDRDDAAPREPVEQQPRHPPRAAAGIENRLVAAQLEPVDDGRGHRDLRARDPVVGVGVPATDRAHESAVVTGPARSRSRGGLGVVFVVVVCGVVEFVLLLVVLVCCVGVWWVRCGLVVFFGCGGFFGLTALW